MIMYEETVRLPRFLSPFRALGHITGTFVAAFVLYWSEFRGRAPSLYSWSVLFPAIYFAAEFFPVLKVLNGAFCPNVCIQIDETALILKHGLIHKKIPLDSVVEVSAASAERVKKTTVPQLLYQTSDFLFLDRKHSSNVELLLSGGISKYVATARPEELTRILRFQVERFRRESTFRMIAAHNS